MGKKGSDAGPMARPYFVVCSWCGKGARMARANAVTCSNRCKLCLHRYRRETGFAPEHPQGDLTAAEAIDLLIVELFRRERRRIETAAIGEVRVSPRARKAK